MSSSGWIKLWRRIEDDPLYFSEPFTRSQAWIDLLIIANHKKSEVIYKRGIRVNLERGDIGYSELELAKRWRWSRGKCRRFLAELSSEKEGKIVQQKNNITSINHIINYDEYQGDGTPDGTPDGHQTDTRRYPNKNVKNVKKDKNKEIYSEDFLSFWEQYPNKTGKGKAFESWEKRNPPLEKVLEALKWQKGSFNWTKEGGQFIPHPTTYLNQRRWEDEPDGRQESNIGHDNVFLADL